MVTQQPAVPHRSCTSVDDSLIGMSACSRHQLAGCLSLEQVCKVFLSVTQTNIEAQHKPFLDAPQRERLYPASHGHGDGMLGVRAV